MPKTATKVMMSTNNSKKSTEKRIFALLVRPMIVDVSSIVD